MTATATKSINLNIENVGEVLQNWQQVKTNEWLASCPLPENHTHGDSNPSLAITQEGDKLLLHCRAGCDQKQVWNALRAKVSGQPCKKSKVEFCVPETLVEQLRAHLENSAEAQAFLAGRGISLDVARKLRFGFSPDGKPALAVPHYVDGKLVGLKARTIHGKEFWQEPGSSIDGLFAVEHLDASASEVLIFEGCEDMALVMSHGFNATGILSATSKLSAQDVARLNEYKNIYLIGDQDVTGKRAMDALQKRLDPRKTIRVRLPAFKDIGDVWKADPDPKRFSAYLRQVLRHAQVSRENFDLEDLLTESEVRERQKDIAPYVVDKVVPMNSITMFFGEEKSGKSLLVTYILKCVANGEKVFGALPVSKRPVLYLDRENSNDDIAGMSEHFTDIGPEEIRYRTRETNCPEPDSPGLIAFCEKYRPVVVFDSLTKFSKGVDVFNPAEMSELFDKLLNLCAAGATIIIIHHATKADAEKYANSHQIGANVSRGFAIISENRPKLHRVRLEAKLFRGAEPVNFNLIAFPVISEHGCFGLADAIRTDADDLEDWISAQTKRCTQETIKKELRGMSNARKVAAIKESLKTGRLIKIDGALVVPKRGDGDLLSNVVPDLWDGGDGAVPKFAKPLIIQ